MKRGTEEFNTLWKCDFDYLTIATLSPSPPMGKDRGFTQDSSYIASICRCRRSRAGSPHPTLWREQVPRLTMSTGQAGTRKDVQSRGISHVSMLTVL